MATIEDPDTGEQKEIDGEIPPGMIIRVEGRNDDGELIEEDRVNIDGQQWIVVDDGVNMVSTDSDE